MNSPEDLMKLSVFKTLVVQGKCVLSQKESILNTFKTSRQLLEFYQDAPLVAEPQSVFKHGAGFDDVLSPAEQEIVNSGLYKLEEIIAGRELTARDRRIQTEKQNQVRR